jgi:hypothetical protein
MATRTITHIRLSGGTEHQHIVRYKWVDAAGATGDNDKPTMVDWIENKNGQAYVGTGSNRVAVGVVHPPTGQPCLRTHADRQWTNNLLALPHF